VKRFVVCSNVFLGLLTLLVPGRSRAELDDQSLSTLEYGVDAERVRGLKLRRPPETDREPWAVVKANAEQRPMLLDPRPELLEDLPLYETLGLVSDSEEGRREVHQVSWPWLKAGYVPAEGGGTIVVATDATSADHVMAVGLAALDQNFDLGSLAARPDRDQQLAAESMFLGDAAMFWLSRLQASHQGDLPARERWGRDLLREALARSGHAHATRFVDRLVEARFMDGLGAVMAVRDVSPWGGLDDMYQRGLPLSTAQVLHPETLLRDQQRRTVRPSKIEALAARGSPEEGVLGELRLRLWLETWLDSDVAARAAAGWAGDRYQLVPPPAGGPSKGSTLVLLTAWDQLDEPGVDEARDFAGAVKTAVEKQALGPLRPLVSDDLDGATAWTDGNERAALVEQREDKVLFIAGCEEKAVAQVRREVWEEWTVGHVDLSSVGVDAAAPPPPIVPMEPEAPWYKRTPGLVALFLWLALALPLAAFSIGRKTSINPVRFYVLAIVTTGVLVFIGWLVGL